MGKLKCSLEYLEFGQVLLSRFIKWKYLNKVRIDRRLNRNSTFKNIQYRKRQDYCVAHNSCERRRIESILSLEQSESPTNNQLKTSAAKITDHNR